MTREKKTSAVSGDDLDVDIQRVRISGKLVAVDIIRLQDPEDPEGYVWRLETLGDGLEGRKGFETLPTYPEARDRAREVVDALDRAVASIHRGRQAALKVVDTMGANQDAWIEARVGAHKARKAAEE